MGQMAGVAVFRESGIEADITVEVPAKERERVCFVLAVSLVLASRDPRRIRCVFKSTNAKLLVAMPRSRRRRKATVFPRLSTA